MAILTPNDKISKEEILKRFVEVVRDYITSRMTADANTVWTPVHTAGSITTGGTPSGKALVGRAPDLPDPNLINDVIKADTTNTSSILRVLRDTMVVYARNQLVYFNNTGNLGGSNFTKLRLTTSNGLDASMEGQIQNSLNSYPQFNKDVIIPADVWESFFQDCKVIWGALCDTSNIATYNYYYCHSNHSSHGNHGSRGRR